MSSMNATDVVRAYCDAWSRGDAMGVLSLYHDDLTLEWPGRHALAGVYSGQAAAVDALLELQAITNRSPVELVDVLVGEHSVMAVVRERWIAEDDDGSATIEVTRGLDYTVVEGKLHTCRVFEMDQPAIDDWIERFGPVSGG